MLCIEHTGLGSSAIPSHGQIYVRFARFWMPWRSLVLLSIADAVLLAASKLELCLSVTRSCRAPVPSDACPRILREADSEL